MSWGNDAATGGLASRFFMARWVTLLLGGAAVACLALMPLAIASFIEDAEGDPLGALVPIAFVVVTLGGLIVAPGLYMGIRRLLGIPMLTVDSRGMVLGGSWDRDLAVEWTNVRRIRVRTTVANGITDHQLLIDLIDERPLVQRARLLRQKAVLATNRLMFRQPFGVSTAYLHGSAAIFAAVQRHYRGDFLPADA
jgi:hypothetical protein